MNRFISNSIVLPASDLIQGRTLSRQLRFFRKSQFWTEAQLIAFQNEALSRLVLQAYTNVPFYRELFDALNIKPHDIKSQKDLNKLPVLSKSDIRDGIRNGKMIAGNIPEKDLISNSSSGSTGEPLQFYETRLSDDVKKASAIRAWEWMDFQLGDKVLRVNHVPRKSWKKRVQDYFSGNDYIYANNLNDDFFQNLTERIKRTKPDILRITPDALGLLTFYIEKNEITGLGLKAVNTTGSVLHPQVRYKAEKYFDCKVFDSFSCEGGAVVFECPTHSCYHSAMEYAITEVLDAHNQPAERGRLITTNLWNYATPFIRYDTQDVIELTEIPCACGRELLSVSRIFGRESDILITPRGKHLIVNNFTGRFQEIKEIEQFQINQNSISKFLVSIKVNNSFNDDAREKLIKLLFEIIGEDAEIEINVVEDIPVGKSGKRRFLIRDKEIPLF